MDIFLNVLSVAWRLAVLFTAICIFVVFADFFADVRRIREAIEDHVYETDDDDKETT